jgi:hypothetical protein
MPSIKTFRARKQRQAPRSSLRLESLEPRLPLAGNVTAQLSGGTLFLTGDALDNALIVASVTGGKMAVIGNPGTTINGSANPFVTSKAVTNIIANLNGGSDAIGFGNSAEVFATQLRDFGITLVPAFDPLAAQAAIDAVAAGATTLSLPGSLTVTTGDGNDLVGIVGNVRGSVVANLGSAIAGSKQGNGFVIGNPLVDPLVDGLTSRVDGAVSVVGGAQQDSVILYGGSSVSGGVTLALGNGRNTAEVVLDGGSIGSFAYAGGTGDDGVVIGNKQTVQNSINVFTGTHGKDAIGLFFGVTVGGSVSLNTGTGADDDLVQIGANIRGNLSVATGAGNDIIGVSTNVGLGLAINSGAGNDLIEFGSSTVGLNTVVDAGAGNDRVFSRDLTTRYNLFVYLGAGNDELTLNNLKAFAAFLYGGTGTNSLTTNAATRTGVRTLRSFQFQTVTNA